MQFRGQKAILAPAVEPASGVPIAHLIKTCQLHQRLGGGRSRANHRGARQRTHAGRSNRGREAANDVSHPTCWMGGSVTG